MRLSGPRSRRRSARSRSKYRTKRTTTNESASSVVYGHRPPLGLLSRLLAEAPHSPWAHRLQRDLDGGAREARGARERRRPRGASRSRALCASAALARALSRDALHRVLVDRDALFRLPQRAPGESEALRELRRVAPRSRARARSRG